MNGEESFTLDGQTLTWQANGKDITYQGASDKPLPVTPVITATLDGEETSLSQLKEKAVAEKLLALLSGDAAALLDAWNQMGGQAAGYDLRNEAWETTTLYIFRTDFN